MRPEIIVHPKFFGKFDIDANGCWNWIGYKNNMGYGVMKHQRKSYKSHRLSYILHVGEITNGLCVLHRCDNPLCVNPKHLFLGYQKDNADDKVSKGRQYKGERHHECKLTDEQVKEIRSYDYYRGLYVYLSEKYNVGRPTISEIRRMKQRK